MVCLQTISLQIFKGCFPQILLGPFLNNLPHKATASENVEADTLLYQDKLKNPRSRLVNKTVNEILDDINRA